MANSSVRIDCNPFIEYFSLLISKRLRAVNLVKVILKHFLLNMKQKFDGNTQSFEFCVEVDEQTMSELLKSDIHEVQVLQMITVLWLIIGINTGEMLLLFND